jgi:glycosyltransferase involved in cell wall biosynthesis
MNKPSLSIVIPTFNSASGLKKLLDSISRQNFPKKKVELIISDGGSSDKTLEIAKRNNMQIVNNPDTLAEPGIYHGMKKAKGELVMVLAVDNDYKTPNALKTIVNIFNDTEIFAAFPRHESTKQDSLFTKYVNTFTDPFNHFLYGNAANARTFNKIYKRIKHNNIYDVYDFKSSRVQPLIAIAQGFTARKEFAIMRKEKMDDIASIIDIINKRKKIAYVHSIPLYHHTIRNLNHFIRKQKWASKNALEGKRYGIYIRKSRLTKIQKLKMIIFPLYSLSVIFPVIRAIIGLVSDREVIWLFHPYISFISAVSILQQIIIMKLGFRNPVSRT